MTSIIEEIAELIRRGDVKPGERLPSERILAQRFGVGRPAIREALRGLERNGIIQVRDRSGAFVNHFHADQLFHADVALLALHVDDTDLLHVVEVRRINEPAIAELAALRRSPEHLAAMADNLEQMRMAVAFERSTVQLDMDFHDLVVEATGNPFFARMMKSISSLLIRSREITSRTLAGPGKALAFHVGIYQAIQAGDSAGARHAMSVHLDDIEAVVRHEFRRLKNEGEVWTERVETTPTTQ